MNKITRAYIETAIWENVLDSDDMEADFAALTIHARTTLTNDVTEFLEAHGHDISRLKELGITDEMIGHDLWKARNRVWTTYFSAQQVPVHISMVLTAYARRLGNLAIYRNGTGEIEIV